MTLGAAGGGDALLVMTYNVLAQCYVRSSFFPYCHGGSLKWKNRSKKLVRPCCWALYTVDPL